MNDYFDQLGEYLKSKNTGKTDKEIQDYNDKVDKQITTI